MRGLSLPQSAARDQEVQENLVPGCDRREQHLQRTQDFFQDGEAEQGELYLEKPRIEQARSAILGRQ